MTDFRGVLTKTTTGAGTFWHSAGIEDRLPGYAGIPAKPTGLSATPGSNSAALSWDAVTGADSIAVYYREGTEGAFTLATAAVAGDATSYNLTGIDPETLYNWYITATNAAGTSEPSDIDDFTTTAASGALSLTGTIAHGETITITTDGTYDFGTRTNAKPLYVYAGENSKNGSTLGRVTTDFFAGAASLQTTERFSASFSHAVKYNHKGVSAGSWGDLQFDPTKQITIYRKILRDYDILDEDYQNASGGFNLKTYRIWAGSDASGPNNFYIGYQGSEGGNARGIVESVPENITRWYDGNPTAFAWQDDMLRYNNSTAVDTMDGRFRHYLDSVFLNSDTDDTLLITHGGSNTTPPQYIHFDQVSNGSGSNVDEVPVYYQFIMVDDEVRSVWVGDADTIAGCTQLLPLPSTAWSSTSVSAKVFDLLDLSTCYFYIQTGWDNSNNTRTWVSTTGIR